MDYEKAAKAIEDSSKFWKVPEGETVVVPLAELGEGYEKDMNGKRVKCHDLLIEVNKEQKTWSLKEGGKKSLLYKVLVVARAHKTLVGVPLRIIRTGKGMDDTVYIVLDASKPAQ